MTALEITQIGSLLYTSQASDNNLTILPLMGKRCGLSYFSTHSLDPIEEIIVGLIADTSEKTIDLFTLGSILGFDVEDNPVEGRYLDDAEKNIYLDLLQSSQEWGLVSIVNNKIYLTALGSLASTSGLKYRFFNKNVQTYDFLYLRNHASEEVIDFPFFKELGVSINLDGGIQVPYDDEMAEIVSSLNSTDELERVRLQCSEGYTIYDVTNLDYFTPTSMNLDVRLYEYSGMYYIVFLKNGIPCERLFELYEYEINKFEKEKKIEWALLYQILNDPDAILEYKNIGRFADILEYDKIIPDLRVNWNDKQLLDLIIQNSNGDNWEAISRFCDSNVLENILDKYRDYLNWAIITRRVSDDFIYNNSRIYPWQIDMLFERNPVSKDLVCKFLLEYQFPDGKDDGLWDWEKVIDLVDIDFIKTNISHIPFNLYSLTAKLGKGDWSLTSDYPDALWNWNHIVNFFDIDFLIQHISTIASHIRFDILFDRIFADQDNINRFIYDVLARKNVLEGIKSSNEIYNVNNKKYIWSDDVINFFEEAKLLNWESGSYYSGFECNPYLTWDIEFFSKYNTKVHTLKGHEHISHVIDDLNIVKSYPEFGWNYTTLSSKEMVYGNISFIKEYKDVLDSAVITNSSINSYGSAFLGELFDIFGDQYLLNLNQSLRSQISSVVEIDYVRKHINLAWDWSVLTSRLCHQLRIDIIGKADWVDKWNWDYLSNNRSIKDIMSYSEEYANLWNWAIVVDRLNKEDILSENNLSTLEKVLSLADNTCSLRTSITQKFSLDELIKLSSYEGRRNDFSWDYQYIYSRPEFSAKDYLDNHLIDVCWEEFSCSPAVNRLFSRTGKGSRQSLWIQHYNTILENKSYHWDFGNLTKLENVLRIPQLFKIDKAWDWEFVSKTAPWISFEKKKDYYLKLFIKNLSFEALSSRTDIGLTEAIVGKYDKYGWDWNAITNNESIVFSFEYINNNPDKPWNWSLLSSRDDLTNDILINNISKPWDWNTIVQKPWFIPSLDVLNSIYQLLDEDSWVSIAKNKEITQAIIDRFETRLDWKILLQSNSSFDKIFTASFIQKHYKLINWELFNERVDDNIDIDLIKVASDNLDWRNVSKSQKIDFTEELIHQYEDRWYWSELIKNPKVVKQLPMLEREFSHKVKSAAFVNRLNVANDRPCIYHFTHLFNAIDVIKSRKILSRDRALELGLLKYDSAGSVIGRSAAAHPYARFYFRPCTPTQYYNEALGADSKLGEYNRRGEWKSKYGKALSLGLPKCPIPVFFKFDLEEVLSVMKENCYYSDRNMQSDCPRIYNVLDEPGYINTTYLYSSMEDAFRKAISSGNYDASVHAYEMDCVKRYSQQEFLVKSEFDFSSLKNYEIICYDESYAKLLRTLLGDDPICDRITCENYYRNYLFERENRSISLEQNNGENTITTDFEDEHYFIIKSDQLGKINIVVNEHQVISESSGSLKIKEPIRWETTSMPLQIYFVDPNARTKEWLIYENTISSAKRISIPDGIVSRLDDFVTFINNLPIKLTKDCFTERMLHSYHGIGHTTRVLFYSYMLATLHGGLSFEELKALCIAAIIHDLGKQYDKEGAIHGFKSAELYKDEIKQYGLNESLQNRILSAVTYHSIDDKDCPIESMRDIITIILKDADALDRSRLPGKGCDSTYLRLSIFKESIGHEILSFATLLPSVTLNLQWDEPTDELVGVIKNVFVQ